MHIVMINTKKARFDPFATSASFFFLFSCIRGLVFNEVDSSSSSVGFMRDSSVDACIPNRLPVEYFQGPVVQKRVKITHGKSLLN